MAELNQLHVKFIDIGSGRFDAKKGWLNLKNSGTVTVTIKEYHEELENFEKETKEKGDLLKKKYVDQVAQMNKQLDKEWKKTMEIRLEVHERKAPKDLYDKQMEEYQKKSENYRKQSEQGAKERDKALEELYKKQKEGKQAILDKYKNVRWVSQVARDGLSDLTPDSYFSRIEKGTVVRKYTLDEFLEGGGLIYTEPFFEGTQPCGKAPYGAFISAEGTTHDVVSVQWMTPDNRIITPDMKVAFGSTVYLNIYTEGLFGQNIQVGLKDKDYVVYYFTLTWKNGNDYLPAYERQNPEEVGGEEPEIIRQDVSMIRSVDVYQIKNTMLPAKAKTGNLGIITRETEPDKPEELVLHVQKSSFEVFIDPRWEDDGGSELEIFAVVGHKLLPTKSKTREMDQNEKYILRVNAKGQTYENLSKNGNQVTSVTSIESNMANFEHCKYEAITAMYGMGSAKEKDIFRQGKVNVGKKELVYEVVAKETPDTLFIGLDKETTRDCNHENTPKDHTGKVITLAKEKMQPSNLLVRDDQVSFDIFYPKPTLEEAIDMAFMTEEKREKYLKNYKLKFDTCRFQHDLDVIVYPDLEYEIGFKLKTENPFYTGQTKAYTERKYLGKKGFFDKKTNKQIRKNQRNQRKEDYKNKKQEVEEGRLNFDSFEIAAEYSFGGAKQSSISIDGEHPFFNVLDTIMWIGNMVGNLTFNKEANEAETEINNDKDKAKELKNRKKNHNKYLKKAGKTLNKIPLKIDIEGPVFSGAVAWKYDPSTKYDNRVGTSYAVKFKADPLIGVTGRLDLLFVATKIPYVGAAVKGITAAADAVGSADDFWNSLVELFGGGDDYKIKLDIDYYLDLYCSGKFTIGATAIEYHTVDGFRSNDLTCQAEIEFGIECGGSMQWKIGKIVGEAEFTGAAFAKFTIERDEKDGVIRCKYDGLYAKVSAKINTDAETRKGQGSDSEEESPKKFLIHDGFTYETKIN